MIQIGMPMTLHGMHNSGMKKFNGKSLFPATDMLALSALVPCRSPRILVNASIDHNFTL